MTTPADSSPNTTFISYFQTSFGTLDVSLHASVSPEPQIYSFFLLRAQRETERVEKFFSFFLSSLTTVNLIDTLSIP